ncbi:aromatic amino acid transport family protein [Desulfovibrio oxyclinae]|uniref:aromatic amino acid transport family protein n=1 Tax=Desulfovibrio oxyclinae TaxID=63560 RepID=UPI000379263C|nr:aromatic amino acid transport family protein [Desulfovibrio oxyclinae]
MAIASRQAVITSALVVTGNMVGAGILALPVNLGPAGVLPALSGIVLMWLLMTTTAIIYSEQKSLVQSETADLPSFFGSELGTAGKWISIVANLIILYGVLVAYLAGVASIINHLFHIDLPGWVTTVGYFAFATLMTSFGAVVMARGNAVLMLLMWGTFAMLVFMTVPTMSATNLGFSDWGFLPSGLPVLITAFHFHNIIPTICRTLKQDRRAIRTAIIGGTSLGLFMNIVWVVVVCLALPLSGADDSVVYAFRNNLPATIPLAEMIASPVFMQAALVFSVVAMTTSFMANGTALLSFIRDLTSTYLGVSGMKLVWPLAFLPPLAVGIFYPDVFLIALNIAGGLGENLLFGILPGFLLVRYFSKGSFRHRLGLFLVAAFSAVLIIELGQEFGLLNISPDVEYWTAHHVQP